jgi:DNA-binding NtrC family response regulator
MIETASKVCVLLIDDEVTLLEVIGLLLEKRGYEVLIAQSVKEANIIWNLNKHRINVVITDTWLAPDENTKELLSRFKKELPEISILVTSGGLIDEDTTAKWDSRVINYLPKPFDPLVLIEALKQLVPRN